MLEKRTGFRLGTIGLRTSFLSGINGREKVNETLMQLFPNWDELRRVSDMRYHVVHYHEGLIRLKEDLKESKTKNIINLASNEYFSAVNPKDLEADIYKIDFKEKKEDKFKIVAIYAKRARGTMSNFIIKNRISKPEDLKGFKENGYKYNKSLSSERDFIFTR